MGGCDNKTHPPDIYSRHKRTNLRRVCLKLRGEWLNSFFSHERLSPNRIQIKAASFFSAYDN